MMKSMKNLFRVIVPAAFALLAASCTQEICTESIPANVRKYSLTIDQPTKTDISGTGSTRLVSWCEGDAIKYYTESAQSSPASAAVSIGGNNASVEIPRGRSDEFINAVYGASQLTSASSSETLMYVNSPVKDSQSYTTFSQAHLCAAFSDDIENPELRFHNISSILIFKGTAKVRRFVIYGNNNETLTSGGNGALKIAYAGGTVSAQPASSGGKSVSVQTDGAEVDFYVSILPVVFSAGITVECYDAGGELIAVKKTGNEVKAATDAGTGRILALGNAQGWITEALPVAVDLGLSVKWARYNLGATEPEEYGNYFAWGETAPKDEYKWSNYAYQQGSGKNGPFSKYVLDSEYGAVDHKSVLDLADDAAHAAWGGDWRMPSAEEVQELMNKCNWSWISRNGVYGYRVASKTNGNSIFLPANGMNNGSSVSDAGTVGNYWSSSISAEQSYYSLSPYFSSSYIKSGNCYRYFGLGIRPVQGAIVPVASIEIPHTLDLIAGRTTTLSATVSPSTATYKGLTWSSSDDSIATVDASGKVTAVSIGKATITAYSADAATTGACEVSVTEAPKPQAVDLGLPSGLKWASWNVGASAPEEYGDYFAWGETVPKEVYDWSTYKWCNGALGKLTKYCTDSSCWDSAGPMDNKTTLDLDDDAAHINCGGSWRMPTDAEWTELRENCTWTWTTQNGVNGRRVTSKTNSNSIFLPAAGRRYFTYLYNAGSCGYYWSSSLNTDNPNGAWYVYFNSDDVNRSIDLYRFFGFSVRPVSE